MEPIAGYTHADVGRQDVRSRSPQNRPLPRPPQLSTRRDVIPRHLCVEPNVGITPVATRQNGVLVVKQDIARKARARRVQRRAPRLDVIEEMRGEEEMHSEEEEVETPRTPGPSPRAGSRAFAVAGRCRRGLLTILGKRRRSTGGMPDPPRASWSPLPGTRRGRGTDFATVVLVDVSKDKFLEGIMRREFLPI